MGNWGQFSVLRVCLLFTIVTLSISFGTTVASQDLSISIEGTIDNSLTLAAGNEIKQTLLGVGEQIYEFNGTQWALVNISAYLYNFKGKKIGYHFFLAEKDVNGGQATWETFKPFSSVTAKTVSRVPAPQPNSIDWLLNEATSNSGDWKRFGSTTYVQRLYTIDGKARAYLGKTGDVFKSSYSALYTFADKSAHTV